MSLVDLLLAGQHRGPAYDAALDAATAEDLRGVLELTASDDSAVRFAAVVTLPAINGYDAPTAEVVDAAIRLTNDPDKRVRDWACFALAQQWREVDTPALRETLLARVDDIDRDARSEALVGLAYRRDPRALPLVAAALARPSGSLWKLELVAAGALSDPSLHGLVLQHQTGWDDPRSVAVAEAVRRLTDPEGPGSDVLEGVAELYRRRSRDEPEEYALGWWLLMNDMLDIAPYRAPEFLDGVLARLVGDDRSIDEVTHRSVLAGLAEDWPA